MNTKQKRQTPRLDRRNAIKNINYDASLSSTPSSSSSFDDHSTHRTRSLDLYPVSDLGSFRIKGVDGEFDQICRSLGLSGPEDFAIPDADREARKVRSPSDHFPTSRLKGVDGEFDQICRSLGLSGPEDFAIPDADREARKVRSPSDHFPTSRFKGVDGEFDQICRSLGLSGPEDFAIPDADREARKVRSPSDHFPTSRFKDHYNSPRESADLSDSFGARVRVWDEVDPGDTCCELKSEFDSAKTKTLLEGFGARVRVWDEVDPGDTCCELKSEFDSAKTKTLLEGFGARVRVSDEGKHGDRVRVRESGEVKDEGTVPSKTFVNSVRVRRSRDGEFGIKGVRPPLLAPPAILPSVVDNENSNWELEPSYGPQNGGHVNHLNVVEENEDVDGGNVGRRELNEERLSNTAVLSESCSDSSNDDKDDEPCNSSTTEHEYSISPNGRFNWNIMSWQKGDFLGSGSFGTVYEGFIDNGFCFAVKEVSLLDQGSQGKQSIYQLEQEIYLLRQFEHENIVQYLGTDTDDGKLYIFFELVTKGSLANLYQTYNLGDSQVSAYTRQILSGLSYLHGRNVVHRDIKCANILVDASGSVKLADFGLVKATKLNDVKSCKGTAFWMAPEVVNRKSRGYGLAADIWSLGCTVLEMLTRQIPYSHLEGMQALFRIGRGEPPPIPNSLSKDAQDFILKCLQVDPDNRPTAVELLDHPFVRRPLTTFSSPHHSGSRS